jgi:glycosyltransferase involved in cell wall biosynthesis
MKIPYAIFQGIYATKRKRHAKTRPGFFLNRKALTAADHVFTNKEVDLENLKRLLPGNRITYVVPGIKPGDFAFDPEAREALRRSWKVGYESVILSAAMFRPGVKAEGIAWVIRSCGDLFRKGHRFHLVIAGEGKEKMKLVCLAKTHLPGRVRFLGKLPRNVMHRFYSAGDIFVFPGIKESLGMVFLEAQSCGLPVIAFANGGIPEVVRDRVTGYLTPLYDRQEFIRAVELLLTDEALRGQMGQAAGAYVRKQHDQNKNYRVMEEVLEKMVKAMKD